MRFIINYFRQAFCKHIWHIEEKHVESYGGQGEKVYMRCERCGYSKNHWKYW